MPSSHSADGWSRLAFGDIAEHVAERVEPTPADGETYVGLEHLDSGSLTVLRWGSEVALIGTKLRMRKGDILFARRNAYLRRVALAPHGGLFSAHGMVLRARPDRVLPEFLPFFMQSDVFMDRAVQISVGSLSPTINWGTLKEQMFGLPPLHEQRRLVEVLIAAQQATDAFRRMVVSGQQLLTSLSTETLRQDGLDNMPASESSAAPPGWRVVTFEQVTERITYGFTNPMPTTADGPWMVTGTDVRDGQIDYSSARHTSQHAFDNRLTDKSRTRVSDVLLTKDGTLGRVAVVDRPNVCINQSVAVLRPNESILPEFLAWVLRAPLMQRRLLLDAGGSAVRHLYITKVAKTHFLLPALARQQQITRILTTAEAAIRATRMRQMESSQVAQGFLDSTIRAGQ